MTLGEAKDQVREHFGRLGFNTPMLVQALARGRRLVEQQGNFWWMAAEKNWTITVAQGSYNVIVATSNGLNLPLYKHAAALSWKLAADTLWLPVHLGEVEKPALDRLWETDDDGEPEDAVIQNNVLYIYPPAPAVAYAMKLYYYTFTANPTLNSDTDDLLTHFPDLLIYAAHVTGYEQILKDMQGAMYWRGLFDQQLLKLRHAQAERMWQDVITFEPRRGPGQTRNWVIGVSNG